MNSDLVPSQNNPSLGVATEVESQRAVAEVQASIVTAKRFPRDAIKAIEKINVACQRPGLAAQALYTYARGGTDITGPSIRLAEAIAHNWGNLRFGTQELEQRPGISPVETFCWDVETNTRQVKHFHVPHEWHTRNGLKKLTDPRDIYEMVANNGARRLRACILSIIPGDVVTEAVRESEKTLVATASITPAKIKAMAEHFAEHYRVTQAQIEARIQRKLEAVTPAQYISLRKIANSLRDSISTPSDWFDMASGGGSLADQVQVKPETKPDAAGETGPDQPSAPEEPAPNPEPGPDKAEPEKTPEKAGTLIPLGDDDIRKEINSLLGEHYDGNVAKMNKAFQKICQNDAADVDKPYKVKSEVLPKVLELVQRHVRVN